MSTADISSISITIEDGVKKAEDYAPARKASVTLSASVVEGADPEAAIEWVRRLADAKVYEIIHNKPAKPVPIVASSPSSGGPSSPETKADAAPFSKNKGHLEAAAVIAAGGKGKRFPPAKSEKKAEEPKEDASTTDEISDQELANAVIKKNNIINNPQLISGLLIEYGGRPAPKQVRDISQDQRAKFLEELEKLS
jgi:hypothetical protein